MRLKLSLVNTEHSFLRITLPHQAIMRGVGLTKALALPAPTHTPPKNMQVSAEEWRCEMAKAICTIFTRKYRNVCCRYIAGPILASSSGGFLPLLHTPRMETLTTRFAHSTHAYDRCTLSISTNIPCCPPLATQTCVRGVAKVLWVHTTHILS